MSIAEKLQTIAENEQKVFEAGKKSQYDKFWDSLQNYGKRTVYPYGFHSWGDNSFFPKYDIKPTGWAASTFSETTIINFKQRLIDCGVTLDMSKATSIGGLFANAKTNTALPIICTTSATDLSTLFSGNNALVEIEKLVLKSDGSQTFNNTFNHCYELVYLTIEGVIGKTGFSLLYSKKLSKESITSVINALSTTTSGLTVTLSQTAVVTAFGSTTSSEWTNLIATKPNWTINLGDY